MLKSQQTGFSLEGPFRPSGVLGVGPNLARFAHQLTLKLRKQPLGRGNERIQGSAPPPPAAHITTNWIISVYLLILHICRQGRGEPGRGESGRGEPGRSRVSSLLSEGDQS